MSTNPEGAQNALPVTVRQILASASLAGATLLGGAAGLDKVVEEVKVFNSLLIERSKDELEHCLLIFDASALKNDTYQVDVAMRNAFDSGACGILLISPASRIGVPAVRLADKLALPMIMAVGKEPLRFADELRRIVRSPFVVRSDAILRALDRLRKIPRGGNIDDVLSTLAQVLQGSTALLGTEGAIVASATPEDFTHPLAIPLLEVPTIEYVGDSVFLAQGLTLAPREKSTFWLVAKLKSPSASRVVLVGEVLAVSSWFASTLLVAERLERERDARFRLGVLNAITATKERPEPMVLEQLGVLGWQVDGWCTAFHLQVSGDVDPLRILNGSEELARIMRSVGISGPIIERPDGWSGWFVEKNEPPANSYAGVVTKLTNVLTRLMSTSPRIRLHLGIGRPYQGVVGLRGSLAEAKEACTIAQASGDSMAVQHIDEMGVRRILLGWYASEDFAEFAHTLLAPAIVADHDGELIHTLETYLDNQSSPTETANQLGIHRNTVLNRIEKLRSLLTVNLDDPDERLAVQLACRVVKLKRAGA
jgi:purine catabolism regulator